MYQRPRNWLLLGFFTLAVLPLKADESPFVVTGGTSPNGKLAVVVFGDINWNSAEQDKATEKDTQAYLYSLAVKKLVGPLEEVSTDGGSWGHTQANVTSKWSADGQLVAVSFRCGRMLHDFVIYQIQETPKTFRAIPQKLPSPSSGPNAATVYQNVTSGPNSGLSVEGWLSPTELSVVQYGMRPKDPNFEFSRWFNDQGQIRIIYARLRGMWVIKRYEELPTNY